MTIKEVVDSAICVIGSLSEIRSGQVRVNHFAFDLMGLKTLMLKYDCMNTVCPFLAAHTKSKSHLHHAKKRRKLEEDERAIDKRKLECSRDTEHLQHGSSDGTFHSAADCVYNKPEKRLCAHKDTNSQPSEISATNKS